MAGHLKAHISALGRAYFTAYLQKQGHAVNSWKNVLVTKDVAYKVLTKAFTIYSPKKVNHKVTGINEDDLRNFERKLETLNMQEKGALVFIDHKLQNIKVITLTQWNMQVQYDGIIYPVNHNSPLGGRILYREIGTIPTKANLTKAQAQLLTELVIRNKSSKIEQDLFL